MDSDETLYHRVRQGDVRAFDALYARYAPRLFGFLRTQLDSRADAEDVFHEAFLRALSSDEVTFAPRDGESGSFRAWLFRIARNLTLNRRRSSDRGARALEAAPVMEPPVAVDDVLARTELLRALDGAVARLPPPLSEIYQLRSSGLSYEEIASVLEVPLGTTNSRMHQMVSRLREELKSWTAQ